MPPKREQSWRYTGGADPALIESLRNIGITGGDAIDRVEAAAAQLNAGFRKLDEGGKRTANRFKSVEKHAKQLATSLLGAAGLTAGVAGLVAGVNSTIGKMQEFETELLSVQTLLGDGGASIDGYRDRLINLDTRLGSTTELTKGLYQTISAGVQGDPLAFLAEASELAIGGVANTTQAVNLLATALNAYGKTAADAQEASDVLFTTVRLGRTTIPELANSLSRAIPNAEALGIGLRDLNATIATLTAGGFPTTEAVTRINAFVRALVQQNDKLKIVNVDFQRILGEDGMLGIIEALRDVTSGDPVLLAKLLPDADARTAAMALMNRQFEAFSRNINIVKGDLSGAADTATQIQFSGSAAAMRELNNEFDRLIQTAQPIVLPLMKNLTAAFADFIGGLRPQGASPSDTIEELKQAIEDVNEEIEKGPTLLERFNAAITGLGTGSFSPLDKNALDAQLSFLQQRLKIEQSIVEGQSLNRKFQADEDKKNRELFKARQKEEREASAARIKAIEEEAKARKKAEADAERARKKEAADFKRASEANEKVRSSINQRILKEQASFQQKLENAVSRSNKRQRDEEFDAFKKTLDRKLIDELNYYEDVQEAAADAQEKIRRRAERDSEALTGVLADALFGIGDVEQRDFIESFRQLAGELVRQQIFRPLFDQIQQGISESFGNAFRRSAQSAQAAQAGQTAGQAAGAGAGRGAATTGAGAGAGQGGGFNAGSFGSGAAGVGQGIGTADAVNALFSGGDFRGSSAGQLFGTFGVGGTAQNVLGGAGTGAAAGSQFGGYGALIGAVVGALVAGLNSAFSGGSRTEANLVTAPRLFQSQLSDRARVVSPFGQLGLSREGTSSIDAFGAIQRVAEVDEAIAQLLTDRQEAAVTALLQSRGTFDARGAVGEEADVVAQLIQQRFSAILDALGGVGTALDAFGDYEASAENIQGISNTFFDLLGVLQALDEIRNPAEPIQQYQLVLDGINDRYDQLTESAVAYNRSQADLLTLERGRTQAIQAERDDFNDEIDDLILGITDPYLLALQGLENAQENQLANARIIGAEETRVRELHRLELLELEKQFNSEEVALAEQTTETIASLFSTLGSALDSVQRRTGFERDLDTLTANFERVAAAAQAVELPIGRVGDALLQAARDLTRNINQDIELDILAFTNPFEKAIRELIQVQTEEFRNVASAGGNLNRLLVSQRLSQEQLFDQFNQAAAGTTGQITSFLQDLSISQSGGLGVLDRQENAQTAFAQALADRDENAAVSLGGQLIDLARERFASGSGFVSAREDVIDALEQLRTDLGTGEGGRDQSEFQQFLNRFQAVQTEPTIDHLDFLRGAVEDQSQSQALLQTESNRIQNQIASNVQQMNTTIASGNSQMIAALNRMLREMRSSNSQQAALLQDAFVRSQIPVTFGS